MKRGVEVQQIKVEKKDQHNIASNAEVGKTNKKEKMLRKVVVKIGLK